MTTEAEIYSRRAAQNSAWMDEHLNPSQRYALLAVHPDILKYNRVAFVVAIRQTLRMGMNGEPRPLFEVIG